MENKNTDHNTQICEIENEITTDHNHDKYITTQEFNNLTSENFTARLSKTNLASKNDIERKCKFVGRKCNSDHWWNNDKC